MWSAADRISLPKKDKQFVFETNDKIVRDSAGHGHDLPQVPPTKFSPFPDYFRSGVRGWLTLTSDSLKEDVILAEEQCETWHDYPDRQTVSHQEGSQEPGRFIPDEGFWMTRFLVSYGIHGGRCENENVHNIWELICGAVACEEIYTFFSNAIAKCKLVCKQLQALCSWFVLMY